MNSKNERLEKSRLYAILDREVCAKRSLAKIASLIKNYGVDVIQLRDKVSKKSDILKSALLLRLALKNSKTIFIINDYLDVAKIVDADGIHLGQGDLPIETARRILGQEKIIGISCHNLKQALDAQKRGADYIGFGPIFPTPTKPKIKNTIGLGSIKELKVSLRIPFFCIGGINLTNIGQVFSAGAERVAVSRAICKARDIPTSVKSFKKRLIEK
jgi:thiamine-phosphate pyrophosphorylase